MNEKNSFATHESFNDKKENSYTIANNITK